MLMHGIHIFTNVLAGVHFCLMNWTLRTKHLTFHIHQPFSTFQFINHTARAYPKLKFETRTVEVLIKNGEIRLFIR